ncbi:MAG: S-layer protein [Candidatus Diapherotrites archaeon]|nr:S-layer protein [Candidatus Diapherotrites archaeon]
MKTQLFRKLAAVGVGAVTIASAFAVGATASVPSTLTPSFFMTDGTPNVAVIVGGKSLPSDSVNAGNIGVAIAAKAYKKSTVTVTGGTATAGTADVTGGITLNIPGTTVLPSGVVGLDTADSHLHLEQTIDTVKSTFSNSDFPNMLSTQASYSDAANTTYKYDEYLTLQAQGIVTYGKNTDADPDEVGLFTKLPQNQNIWKYEAIFDSLPSAASSNMKGTTWKIMGRDYYIYESSSSYIYMLSGTNSVSVSTGGASQTVTVGGKSFTVTLNGVGSRQQAGSTALDWYATGVITGPNESKSIEMRSGDVVEIDGVRWAVKTVISLGGGTGTTTFYAGADKIRMDITTTTGTAIKVNDTTSDDVYSFATTGSYGFYYKPTYNVWIQAGEAQLDPISEQFNLSFSGYKSGNTTTVKIQPSGTQVKLDYYQYDGKHVSTQILGIGYGSNTYNMTYEINDEPLFVTDGTNSDWCDDNVTIDQNSTPGWVGMTLNDWFLGKINAAGYNPLVQITKINHTSNDLSVRPYGGDSVDATWDSTNTKWTATIGNTAYTFYKLSTDQVSIADSDIINTIRLQYGGSIVLPDYYDAVIDNSTTTGTIGVYEDYYDATYTSSSNYDSLFSTTLTDNHSTTASDVDYGIGSVTQTDRGASANWSTAITDPDNSYKKTFMSTFGSTGEYNTDSDTWELTIPESESYAQLYLVPVGSSATGSISASSVTVDETTTVGSDLGGGISVTGNTLAADAAGATCSGGTATAKEPTNVGTLVFLDSSAPAGNLVVVGGWMVNSAASDMGLTADLKARGDSVIKLAGNKVAVAGYTAADTTYAANQLISWINSNL